MSEPSEAHWERVYQTRPADQASWYQAVPERSLAFIAAAGLDRDAPILDVGGGASTLVDQLLAAGFTDVTVLDLAHTALTAAQARLGAKAARVNWIAADVTEFQPSRRYALWHDRAVFHFLRHAAQRAAYLKVLRAALAPHGHVVLATFGPEGPTHCSGLEVERYSAGELSELLGSEFRLLRSELEEHVTPSGATQQFTFGLWRRG